MVGALGPEGARALMAADNEPAESALRANTLRTDRGRARRAAAGAQPPGADLPEGLVLEAPFDALGAPEWREGLFMPQSRAAMTVARLLGPRPGSGCSTCAPRPAARRPTSRR